MKRLLLAVAFLGILFSPSSHVYAVEIAQEGGDYFDLPLCLPGMSSDGTCLPYGPAQTVNALKEEGIPYPLHNLAAAIPSADMGVMPINVAKINIPEEEPALVYISFEDAVAGVNPVGQIEPASLRFVSYVTRMDDRNGNAFVELASGGWLRASPAAYTNFQGLVFFETPKNDFGWIIDQTPGYITPSFSSEENESRYYQYDVVQVFDSVEANGVTWYKIAHNEWVNSMKIRVVNINTTPPEGLNVDRWIEVNLLQQTISVYEDGRLIFATLAATGAEPYYTQPGVFEIYDKQLMKTMQGAFEIDRSDFYYLEDVPWTMFFDEGRALHATYWHTLFGYQQSHGCVNLSPGDANWLYQWAELGEVVWVHDPSGRTPTDEAFYGPGAP
jgi:lipoprotein-anchoring transpeptidase ErfK/SrfK